MTESFTPIHFLCVHQGYELYGSDRTLISSVEALRGRYPQAKITIILPREGELARTLSALGFDISIEKIWVARKANGALKNLFALLAFPYYVARARQRMKKCTLAYINTSVVFDYAVASRLAGRPAILHVHEIPTGLAMRVIRGFIYMAKADLVYNSAATKRAFAISSDRRQSVLHNGISLRVAGQDRSPFSDNFGRVRLLMIGRINSWKGQDLLVEAVAALPTTLRRKFDMKFAGATFESGQEAEELARQVQKAGVQGQVQFEGFVKDPFDLYQWADIVVVPSKKPEPFGLVAVEAMAHSRPVIAANHGGLTEIVVHERTGLLFTPGNAQALSAMLSRALANPAEMQVFGRQGQARYRKMFTETKYKKNFVCIVEDVLRKGRDRNVM